MECDYDIVAIDDDALDLEILTRTLSKTPYRLKCFEDSDEALLFLALNQPRFLITDYRMGPINGIEFLKQLSKVVDIELMCIFLTSGGQVQKHVSLQAVELGAQILLKDEIYTQGYLERVFEEVIDSSPLKLVA